MIYEFREWFQLTDATWVVIEYNKPIGSPVWTGFAYIDNRNASSLPLVRMTFEEIRTATQFSEMIQTVRGAARDELTRWAGVVGNRADGNVPL